MTAGGAALAGAMVTAIILVTCARRARPEVLAAIAALGAAGTAVYVGVVAGLGDAGTFALVFILEAALTLDTVVALMLLFGYFAVPSQARGRLLALAVGCTVLLRLAAIPLGSAALDRADWLAYPLAGLLVATTFALIRMAPADVEGRPQRRNRTLATAARLIPLTDRFDGDRLRTDTPDGRRWTPMAVAAAAVVAVSALLAVDGVAAGAAVTDDTAVVVGATVLAIAALGAVHQLAATRLAGLLHLKAALSVLLLFAAVRLLATGPDHPQLGPTIAATAVAIVVAVIAHPRNRHDTGPGLPPTAARRGVRRD